MADIFADDVGTVIEITILKEDNTPQILTGVSDIWMIFTNPKGTKTIKKKSLGEVTVVNDTAGIISFITPFGFWSAGTWRVSPKVLIAAGTSEFTGSFSEILILEAQS